MFSISAKHAVDYNIMCASLKLYMGSISVVRKVMFCHVESGEVGIGR